MTYEQAEKEISENQSLLGKEVKHDRGNLTIRSLFIAPADTSVCQPATVYEKIFPLRENKEILQELHLLDTDLIVYAMVVNKWRRVAIPLNQILVDIVL